MSGPPGQLPAKKQENLKANTNAGADTAGAIAFAREPISDNRTPFIAASTDYARLEPESRGDAVVRQRSESRHLSRQAINPPMANTSG